MNQRGQQAGKQAVGILMIVVGVIGVIILMFNIISSADFPSISQFMASSTPIQATSTVQIPSKTQDEIDIPSPIKEVIAPRGNISVEISNTPSERERGLSGRKYLNAGTGMLFIFPTSGFHSFWMKDMNFPLDIIWINADRKVVGISENISPYSYPSTFKPDSEVQFVLEMNAREASLYGIVTGTVLKF